MENCLYEVNTLAALPVPPAAKPLHTFAVFHARQAALDPSPENRQHAADALARFAARIRPANDNAK